METPGTGICRAVIRFLRAQVRGTLSIILFLADTLAVTVPFYTVALLKWIIPVDSWRLTCSWMLHRIADVWIYFLNLPQDLSRKTMWVIRGMDTIDVPRSCLLMVNHQTWVDIMVLVKLFYRRIPDFKFFVKRELLWLPIIGQAFWAVDFPIMKRRSREDLAENPQLRWEDLEVTRRACERFRDMPVSVFNFVEGTRFRAEKHLRQRSPFKHLLRPKAGGTALVLGAMGEKVQSILNVTIVYPKGVRNFWDYLCGRVEEIRVHVEQIPVTSNLIGDYYGDGRYRKDFQHWINRLWLEKDRRIDEMLGWQP
ncbi:MAG TPA: acyltransferase [Deltaproteobacteria bacterium]|nr:acyltransferase [Deltaproteobacteria bacterium]HXK46011.1 acyltransferase [Deltaproteobacteria bacterium]